ncbi:MAG: alkaline phosphatase family protein [Gammaproteobacteria bacterium]
MPRKLIILGFDGMEPSLLERYWEMGRCPQLHRLAGEGGYFRLQTTLPAESPVAWASFVTGQNPGRHHIFDFLHRDPKRYLPALSIASVKTPERALSFGPWRAPLGRPRVVGHRDGAPFWHRLAQAGIEAAVIRVPVTYPPEPFAGRLLASMGIPDLHGSQGSYQYWTTDPALAGRGHGGDAVLIDFIDGRAEASLQPLADPFRNDDLPRAPAVSLRAADGRLVISCCGQSASMEPGAWSPWLKVRYRFSLAASADGWVRFYLHSLAPHFNLYCSPVNIDPDRPAAPLSHPPRYAAELKAAIGPYATLGMAEDTWVLNEKRMDEDGFLSHCYALLDERTAMLEFELKRLRAGLLICVYDQPDRLQHMFWRVEDRAHPAYDRALADRYHDVLPDLYAYLDTIVGNVRAHHPDADVLVMSDHGCQPFRRMFHVNRWLANKGYLTLREGATGRATDADLLYLQGVDWGATRAYAMGLVGIYLNLRGRERQGIVATGSEAQALISDLRGHLLALRDPVNGQAVVRRALAKEAIYSGPHVPDAPDLILAYDTGYRASWQTALGGTPPAVLEDNLLAWSGDHCIDPELVPGVILSTRALQQRELHIMDIAPSVQRYFGLEPAAEIEGQAFWA